MAERETTAVAAIRRFNRFHTRWIGALGGNLHGSGFALIEARVLYELAERDGCLAVELSRDLDLDPAYLSRILKRFEGQGWLERQRSDADGRAFRLRLTEEGQAAFRPLEAASRAQAETILSRLSMTERDRLVGALSDTQSLLSGERTTRPRPLIREHRAGDIGWVVSAHGRLYAEDYGWDLTFEALVARVVGFIEKPRIGLDLPLDVRGTAFQQRVWQALQQIRAGETACYAEIARRIGVSTTKLEKVNASDRRDYRDYYTPELVEGVANLYARDLDLFGYEY